ncbi:class I adenylate-forming enzyme family protein [Nocardia sp. NPDC057272]|uniref:class I adenylate-forming enzyme family protein n=1 Tax=Nocardia sp. NPDC057272 TaxID=3346079 RepID=UPI00363069AE
MTTAVIEITRARNPFPQSGVARDSRGTPRYSDVPATLLDALRAYAEGRPDAEAVVEIGRNRLTYSQLWKAACRVAGGLRAAGVRRGDRVALRYPSGMNWVLGYWGTLLAGGVAVVVNTRSVPAEVEFVLCDAGVKVDLAADTPLPDGDSYVSEGIVATDVAALFYTSETTGDLKGVPTTHEALVTNAENMIRGFGLPREVNSDLRMLISVPLFDVAACNSQLLVASYVGGTAVILPVLDLAALVNAVVAERISFVVTAPAVYSLLLSHPSFADADMTSVRMVGYGGSPIAPSLVRELLAAFPRATLTNGYSLTEAASLITVLPDRDALAHADSVGYAVPSVDIGIVPLGDIPNVGELVVRGANVTEGYWYRPRATAETIVGGWLRTGDIARIDDAGRVYLVGRNDSIINRGGAKISSAEPQYAAICTEPLPHAASRVGANCVEMCGGVHRCGSGPHFRSGEIARRQTEGTEAPMPDYPAVDRIRVDSDSGLR